MTKKCRIFNFTQNFRHFFMLLWKQFRFFFQTFVFLAIVFRAYLQTADYLASSQQSIPSNFLSKERGIKKFSRIFSISKFASLFFFPTFLTFPFKSDNFSKGSNFRFQFYFAIKVEFQKVSNPAINLIASEGKISLRDIQHH